MNKFRLILVLTTFLTGCTTASLSNKEKEDCRKQAYSENNNQVYSENNNQVYSENNNQDLDPYIYYKNCLSSKKEIKEQEDKIESVFNFIEFVLEIIEPMDEDKI